MTATQPSIRLQHAAPALVSPPAAVRCLPARCLPASPALLRPLLGSSRTDEGAPWWFLGVHGGAGVTSLIRAGAGGGDAGRVWPLEGKVVVVARRTAFGLEWARDAARQHASGGAPGDVELAGLVVVADAPGRVPRRVARFLDLVAAAYPQVWEIPWVEEWRLAGHAEPLPLP
ncbi:MAG: DUF6668 family protein, partial [Frankiaceae bacterium]